jgi:hypothetical protein
VLAAMQSALRGEFDPLEQYGILLNQATLEAYAMEQGIWDGSTAMTNQQKVMATQGYILDNLGAAQGDFARTSGGLANTSKILRAQLADLSAEMGKVLLPAAVAIAGKLRDLLARFQELSPGVQKWIVLIGLAAAAVGPLLIVLGTLMTMLPAIGAALAVLTGPLGIVLGLIALLGVAYLKNWFGFGDAVNGAVKAGAKFVKTLKQQYDFYRKLGKTPIEAGFSALGIVLENLTGINLNEWFARMGNAMQRPLDAINKLKNAISAGNWRMALAGLGDLLAAPAKLIGDLFKGIETGFAPLDRVFRELGNLVTGFGRLIQEVFQGDWGGALDVAQGMLGNFRDLLGNVISLAGQLGSQALDWALDIGIPTVTGWIVDGAQSLWDWLTGQYPKLKDLAGEILDWGIDVGIPAVKGAIVDAFTTAWDWIKGKVGWVGRILGAKLDEWGISVPIPGVVGDIIDAFTTAWDWIKSKVSWIGSLFGGGGTTVSAETAGTGSWGIEVGIPTVSGAVVDAFATMWDFIRSGASWLQDNVLHGIKTFDISIPKPDIAGGVTTAFTSMWEAAKSAASWLKDTFEQTVTANISIDGAFKVLGDPKAAFISALETALGWAWDGLQWLYKTVVRVEATVQGGGMVATPKDRTGKNDPTEAMVNRERDFDVTGYPNADLPAAQPIATEVVITANTREFDSSMIDVEGRLAALADTPKTAQLDLDITPAATAYTHASTFAEAWAAQTFTATLDADYSPAATAYTNASAFADTWAAATFTATLDADNGPAAVAYTDAYGWGETWAGTTFTARFSADVSPLETALVRVRQIAQEISDLLPNSPAKKGPLARPVSFGYIADALSADLGGMPGVTTDLMSRVRNGLDIGWPDGAMGLAGMGAAGNGFTNNGVVHIDADDPEGLWDALRRQGLAGVRP